MKNVIGIHSLIPMTGECLMISLLTKIKRQLCKHPFNKCNFALIAGRSYTYCTKCGKTWETTKKEE